MKVKCDWCKKEFERVPHDVKKFKHHFCSRECAIMWKKINGRIRRKCVYCGKEFENIRSLNRKFCSHSCYLNWLKIHPPMLGRHFSPESIEKMRKSLKGKFTKEKNPNWRGGKSYEPYTPEFDEELKLKVLKRDNFRCQICGVFKNKSRNNYLQIHHIDGNKKNNSLDNLISLCPRCHGKVTAGVLKIEVPKWSKMKG
jgi:endogenous inhibitor of DNA gyrase (YacG/DUF329 family)